MRKSTKIMGALALATAVVAGGTAFTASNTMAPTVTKGYGSQTITGVVAQSVSYHTTPSGEFINSVRLVLAGDTRDRDIRIAFNDSYPQTCSDAGQVETHPEQYGFNEETQQELTYEVVDRTVYDCAVGELAVASANKFALVAAEKSDPDYALN
jgi:hypothetical protein